VGELMMPDLLLSLGLNLTAALVLVFGILVPVISALQSRWSADRKVGPEIRPQDQEAELLGALGIQEGVLDLAAAERSDARGQPRLRHNVPDEGEADVHQACQAAARRGGGD
jgi:hypothetical protein